MTQIYRTNQAPLNFPLRDFESFVAPQILARGLRYFQKRHVTNVEKNTNGLYTAFVIGNEASPYTSSVTIRKKHITAFSCTCPYKTSICKHIAALLYHIKNIALGGNTVPALPLSFTKPEIRAKTQQLLDTLSLDNIKEFLGEQCEQIQFLQHLLLLKFATHTAPPSPELYARLLRAFLDSIASVNGTIAFFNIEQIDQFVNTALAWGAQAKSKEDILASLYFAGAVIEEISTTEHQIDASTPTKIPCFKKALAYLKTRAEEKLSKSTRKTFFNHCLSLYDHHHTGSHPWTGEVLSIAIKLIKTSSDEAELTRRISAISPTDSAYPQALNLALDILTRQTLNRLAKD